MRKDKKKVGTGQKVFMFVNSLVIVSIIAFYLTRLVVYKIRFDKIYSDSTYTTFYSLLIDNIDLMAQEDGLFENEDGSYSYRGNADKNYCLYSGELYRVLRIESDGYVIMVSENPITNMPLYEYDTFEKTDLFKWLNNVEGVEHTGIFENTLASKAMILTNTFGNYEKVTDLKNVSDNNSSLDVYASVLSVYDYLDTIVNNKSFLNNGTSFWLSNCDNSYNYYYVDETGSIGTQYSKAMCLDVRPVIAVNFTVYATTGSGTVDDPYVLNTVEIDRASDAFTGSYVQLSDYIYRICGRDDNGDIRLIQNDTLKDAEGNEILLAYGSSNEFNQDSSLYKYLHNDFMETLSGYENYLVESTYYKGSIGLYDDFSYLNSYQDSYDGYVGLPTLADMYLNEGDEYFIAMSSNSSDSLIYLFKQDILYGDYYSNKNKIRTVITIHKESQFVSGDGSKNNPFVLEKEVIENASEE